MTTPAGGGTNMGAVSDSGSAPTVMAAASGSGSGLSVVSYPIRIPKDHNKQFSIIKFNDSMEVNFTQWIEPNLERENSQVQSQNSQGEPKSGTGSENVSEAREERWNLEHGDWNERQKFRGQRVEASDSYYVLAPATDGDGFVALPISEWLDFRKVQGLEKECTSSQTRSKDQDRIYHNVMSRIYTMQGKGVYLIPGSDQFQLMELIKESDPDGIEEETLMGLAKEKFNFRGTAKFFDTLNQLEFDGKIEIVTYQNGKKIYSLETESDVSVSSSVEDEEEDEEEDDEEDEDDEDLDLIFSGNKMVVAGNRSRSSVTVLKTMIGAKDEEKEDHGTANKVVVGSLSHSSVTTQKTMIGAKDDENEDPLKFFLVEPSAAASQEK